MKKLVALGLALILLLSLAGCRMDNTPTVEEITERLSAYPNDVMSLRQDETLALNDHSRVFHGELVEEFLRKTEAGEPAELTTVFFTIEGDAIFTYVYFDGSAYLSVIDQSRDAWSVAKDKIHVETYAYALWLNGAVTREGGQVWRSLVLTDDPAETWQELREKTADTEKSSVTVFGMWTEDAG